MDKRLKWWNVFSFFFLRAQLLEKAASLSDLMGSKHLFVTIHLKTKFLIIWRKPASSDLLGSFLICFLSGFWSYIFQHVERSAAHRGEMVLTPLAERSFRIISSMRARTSMWERQLHRRIGAGLELKALLGCHRRWFLKVFSRHLINLTCGARRHDANNLQFTSHTKTIRCQGERDLRTFKFSGTEKILRVGLSAGHSDICFSIWMFHSYVRWFQWFTTPWEGLPSTLRVWIPDNGTDGAEICDFLFCVFNTLSRASPFASMQIPANYGGHTHLMKCLKYRIYTEPLVYCALVYLIAVHLIAAFCFLCFLTRKHDLSSDKPLVICTYLHFMLHWRRRLLVPLSPQV